MKKKNIFYLSLLLSLALHLGFSAFLFLQKYFLPQVQQRQNIVEIDLRTAPIPEKEPQRQIVDQNEQAINQDIDPKAKYLSKNNQKVVRQSVAKNHGQFQNMKNQRVPPEQSPISPPETPPAEKFKKFLPHFDVVESINENKKRQEAVAKNQPQKESRPAQEPGAEVSQTLDYIKDLDPGVETLLSTREFKYYTFYNRVRTQLNEYWTPKVREKVKQLFQEGRTIASSADRITKCLVTLDKGGQLVKVQIIGQSGVQDLDEAAVEAFRAAAPFPNPPSGMVDEDGTIRIRWDFILEA